MKTGDSYTFAVATVVQQCVALRRVIAAIAKIPVALDQSWHFESAALTAKERGRSGKRSPTLSVPACGTAELWVKTRAESKAASTLASYGLGPLQSKPDPGAPALHSSLFQSTM